MKAGFIGLGNMGQGMADNLLRNGADLVVYTRTLAKVDAMVARGATAAASPAEVAKRCDIVMACLDSVETTRDIFMGPDGLSENARPGTLLVDHGTVDLATSRDCSAAAERVGAQFLDAPISGGPLRAADGTLSIMVGGEVGTFEKAKPFFEMMGANVRHMGPIGAGTAMKLINQTLVAIHSVAAAEAFALADAAGVDIELAVDVLSVSWGQSTMVERNGPITAARDFENSAAPARNLVKDIGIIMKLADDMKLAMPTMRESARVFDDLIADGYTEGDPSAALLVLERRARRISQQLRKERGATR